MEKSLLENEPLIRISFFLGLFFLFSLWELLYPNHNLKYKKTIRWTFNLLLVFLNSAIVRVLFCLSAVGVSVYTIKNQMGLLNILTIPNSIKFLIGFIFLDLVIYLQHRLFHKVPLFWRFHRMHHIDLDLDITSGIRFHPFEILISTLIKYFAILLSGVSPFTVLVFEIVLNGMSMFNHSNIWISQETERYLRRFLVTPSLHRIHHSILSDEHHSNFGFNFSIWDFIFRTIKKESIGEIIFGLREFQDLKYSRLDWMLLIPFLKLSQRKSDSE